MNIIENYLNTRTMYRVVTLSLAGIILAAFALSAVGFMSTPLVSLLASLGVITGTALLAHYVLAYIYKAPANVESSLVTALILFLIISPSQVSMELMWASLITLIAILSKYVIAYKYRHVWNPVALAIVIGGALGFGGAIWWVATPVLALPVLLLGLLVVKKIHRFDLVISFLVTAVVLHVGIALYNGAPFLDSLWNTLLSWPVLFFALFMLTEPLSTPPMKRERIVYGVLVGVLSNISFHVGPFFSSPELSLILGNTFSYVVSMHSRAILVLKEKVTLAKDTFEFVFTKPRGFVYTAGQYMEWTVPHARADSRGVRRYFTISSSPADDTVRLGVKMYPNGSTLKQKLQSLEVGNVIYGMHPVGDFVLPSDDSAPVIFVAGGIGITPFISMIRAQVAAQSGRPITLFYANKSYEEIAYLDELSKSGIQIVHLLTNTEGTPVDFVYERGFITMEMVSKYVENPQKCECYVSGPHGMVVNYEKMFKAARVKKVHTDFFPGFV